MRNAFKEFREFISRGNVVDLAVAVIIGSAFAGVINAIVGNLITPLVGMLGSSNFADLDFTINGSTFGYGLVINAVLQFLSVAAAVFFLIVKPLNLLAKMRKSGEIPEEEAPPTQEELLTQIRDLLAAQQG
jgi:large conductance mechanosensitive channel